MSHADPALDRVRIYPAEAPLRGTLHAQASKNYLSRYMWTSALAAGVSRLEPVVPSDDARAMLGCIQALGARHLGGSLEDGWLEIEGFGSEPLPDRVLDADNAGAVLRFILSIAAVGGPYRFITRRMDSLGKRPNRDLLDALAFWGVHVTESGPGGTLPIAAGFNPHATTFGEVEVSGEISSQYLSSLLMMAPLVARRMGGAARIHVVGALKSKPAVETTLDVLYRRGIDVHTDADLSYFAVQPGEYRAGACRVNGDWPGAAAVLCAAACIPGSIVRIEGLEADSQGERRIIEVLRECGCRITCAGSTVELEAPDILEPIRNLDGDLMTDAIPPLMAVAALAQGRSSVVNVENLRFKECDRISEPLEELATLGVEAREHRDAFEIIGNPDGFDGGVTVDGRKDHRVIFLLTICGLRAFRPIEILSASHIAKSYPGFFDDLRQLGARIEPITTG